MAAGSAAARRPPRGGPRGGPRGRGGLVHREVVEDDNVARRERGHQHLVHVRQEGRRIDRAVKDGRRGQNVEPQPRVDRVGLPVLTGRVIVEPCAAPAPAIERSRSVMTPHSSRKAYWRTSRQRQPRPPVATGCRHFRAPLFVTLPPPGQEGPPAYRTWCARGRRDEPGRRNRTAVTDIWRTVPSNRIVSSGTNPTRSR